MIKTMYEFGRHLREIEEMQPYFEMASAPYPENATDQIVLVADIKNGAFFELSIEKYASSKIGKYLFRDLASSRSTSIVPTLHFYFSPKAEELAASVPKFIDKLDRCFANNSAIYKAFFDAKEVAKKLNAALLKLALGEKKNYLFTLRIDGKWLGEVPEIASILEQSSYDKYFRDGKGELYRGENQVCAVRYEKAEEVWGRVDTLGFTVNDIAFSRNGFDARQSFKMFPVSPEAVKTLEGTQKAIERRMSFRFSGLEFFVLPHFVTFDESQSAKKLRLVKQFVQALTEPIEKGFDPLAESIVNSEDVFRKVLADPELGHNSVYYDLFFFEQKQAQFSIKLHVSDVLPSRFRVIRDTKKRLEKLYRPITLIEPTGKPKIEYRLNFFSIKDFFSIKRQKETVIEPYFFKIVEAVFYKSRLDEEQILRAFLQKIVPAFKDSTNNSWAFPSAVKRSFCVLQYFHQLQLFGKMTDSKPAELALNAFDFIAQHPDFFENRLKKAAFLLGSAVELLLNSQRAHLKSEPFAKRLNNLSIDYREMERIKKELHQKSREYADADRLYDTELLQKLFFEFDKLMFGGDDSNASKTSISYAFSVGMTIEKERGLQKMKARKAEKEAKKAAEEAAKKANQPA